MEMFLQFLKTVLYVRRVIGSADNAENIGSIFSRLSPFDVSLMRLMLEIK